MGDHQNTVGSLCWGALSSACVKAKSSYSVALAWLPRREGFVVTHTAALGYASLSVTVAWLHDLRSLGDVQDWRGARGFEGSASLRLAGLALRCIQSGRHSRSRRDPRADFNKDSSLNTSSP